MTTGRWLAILITLAAMAALYVIQSLRLEPDERFLAWGLSTFGLVAGVVTAYLLRSYYSRRGTTTAPESSTWYWPMLIAVGSVPVWSPYLTPLVSMVLVGGFCSFFITTVWLYREQRENSSSRTG